MARSLLRHAAILVVLITSVVRIVIARSLVPRGDLLATCKEIASTTPQMWLVAGSHLGFAEKLFKLRNDKVRGQVQGCHGEESFKTTRPSWLFSLQA